MSRLPPANAILLLGAIGLFGSVACAPPEPPADETERPGVIVEQVRAGVLADRLRPGDRITGFRHPVSSGEVASPFDLWRLDKLLAPLGSVTLEVERDRRRFEVTVPNGRWAVRVRPALPPAVLRAYEEARATTEDAHARQLLSDAAEGASTAATRIWLLVERAGRGNGDQRSAEYRQAAQTALAAGQREIAAQLFTRLGQESDQHGRFEEALEAHGRALALREELAQPIARALVLADLGLTEERRGDPATAERLHRQALEILEQTAPRSLATEQVLRRLARSRATQDDLDEALALADRSLELVSSLAPNGFEHQASLMTQGIFYWLREDWARAEAYLRDAVEMLERLDPSDPDVFNAFHNLGLVASYRGDQVEASAYFTQALARMPADDPIRRTKVLTSLGTTAMVRRDLAAAERYHRQVLEIREILEPDSLSIATPLLNLGEVLRASGRAAEAEPLLERALELQERFVPDSRDPDLTRLALAEVALDLSRPNDGQRLLHAALAHVRARRGETLLEGRLQLALARNLRTTDRDDEARPLLERSIAIFGERAPGTGDHALAVYHLAGVLRRQGHRQEALTRYLQAIELVELQLDLLGGSDENRARFRAEHEALYRETISLLIELGEIERAFLVQERSRGRALVAELRDRGIRPRRAISPELEQRRQRLAARYDDIIEQLAELPASASATSLRSEMDTIRLERTALHTEIRAAVRRSGSLDWLAVRSLDELLADLPPKTLVLSFGVDSSRSHLFALDRRHGLRLFELSASEADLRDRVERFKILLERQPPPRRGPSQRARPPGYVELGAGLYDDLIGPLGAEIDGVSRLIVVPDGPLHRLPFAALVRRRSARGATETSEPWRFLVQTHALQIATSLSVQEALARRPATVQQPTLVAFADPDLDAARTGDPTAPGGRQRVAPLPHARTELALLGELYGERASLFVGAHATELEVTRSDATILHLATHARPDNRSPLDSALMLAPARGPHGERYNGLLQAWEIYDQMSLHSELVTLSACESAIGPEIDGEGLLGLTRAFQQAGARAVLASLWEVSDRSTAALMVAFYRRLADGADRDAALRDAQLTLIGAGSTASTEKARRDPDHSHPYHWAAFQLYGPG